MTITVAVAGETFVAESYESVHLPGRPARLSVGIALPEAPEPDDLESWLGQAVTVSCEGATPWLETRRVVHLRVEGAELVLRGEGASGALDARPAVSAWVDAAATDVAEDIVVRAGAQAEISVAPGAATAPTPYFIQNHRADRDVLDALARAYGFAVLDKADGSVAITDTPPGVSHALDRTALSGCRVAHELQLPISEGRVAVYEENGKIDLLEARAAEAPAATFHEQPATRPGLVQSRDYLEILLEAHADAGSLSRRVVLALPRGDLHVGDLVESEAFPDTMAVAARRATLESRGIVSTVELVEPSRFVAALASGEASTGEGADATPIILATVAESNLQDRPGWCSVIMPGAGDDTPLPAQLLAWGGGANAGPSWLPACEALVPVALVGDTIMPRLVVLGVCRNEANPPATTDAASCVLHLGDDERGSTLHLAADGTFTVKGAEMRLDAERIALKGSEILLTASAIKMEKG